MIYKTIDFYIVPTQKDKNDYGAMFERVTRQIQIYKQRLGDDFTEYFADDNKGVEKIQKIDCPFCEKVQKAFIGSEAYSEDLNRRIVLARCIKCNKHFYVYQEIDVEVELS
jgi:hypothetical protein